MDRPHTEHETASHQPAPAHAPADEAEIEEGTTVQWSPFGPPAGGPPAGQRPPAHQGNPHGVAQVPQHNGAHPALDEPTGQLPQVPTAAPQHPLQVPPQPPAYQPPQRAIYQPQPQPSQFGQPYSQQVDPPLADYAQPPAQQQQHHSGQYQQQHSQYAPPHEYAPQPPEAPVSGFPAHQPPPGQALVPYPDTPGSLEHQQVTADEFALRRAVKPPQPVATTGLRAVLRKATFGAAKLGPSRKEQDVSRAVEMVRRNFGGLRQVTVINPKGGAGKTVAVLMLAMTFGQRRGGYVLAWDNNETQGTLGMRAQQDFHVRTVRDLLRDIDQFRGPTGRVGDLSQYVRAQGEAMFDVLSSDESATAGEMLTSAAFGEIREIVSRFYKLIVVDTGNNVRAHNWQSSMDATDQLVVTMSARNDSAETAARALDHLEQTGRQDLVRRAVTVVSMPAHRKDLDLPAVQRHFAARTRQVLLAPYEKLLDSGEPIRYAMLSQATKDAWLKIAAAVSEGL
ncbi:chromosome partitioning protein [Phytomonospora sp. NPDC050363]|uniref:MinD/ParA family ATP-binding protein n=1 Tax=Phytomonospora sp. NPDC050363 TaxID=3155642 RepID=UPI0033E28A1A